MVETAKPERADKWERVRRLRYGHVIKLILARYGTDGVPDDDAGRPDLMELLYLASQAPARAAIRVANLIELYAPWMQPDESAALIEHLAIIPNYQKARTSEELGRLLHLKNAERERLRLWSIRPCDVSADAFANQSKARSLQKREAKRRASGVKPRIEYLAELKAKPKPWDGSGLSRWQWYRRNKVGTDSKRGVVETIVPKAEPHPVAAEQAEASKGLQGRGGLEKRREQAEEKQVEGEEQRGLSADRPRLVAREPHPLEAALQNWGKNAEKKNSTSSRNRIERGWNDLSDFAAFSNDVPWCPMEALPRDLPLVGELAA